VISISSRGDNNAGRVLRGDRLVGAVANNGSSELDFSTRRFNFRRGISSLKDFISSCIGGVPICSLNISSATIVRGESRPDEEGRKKRVTGEGFDGAGATSGAYRSVMRLLNDLQGFEYDDDVKVGRLRLSVAKTLLECHTEVRGTW
jgi:hypothetical protein